MATSQRANDSSSAEDALTKAKYLVLLQQAEAQVQDAIKMMPEADKQEYLEACQACPDLVRKESDCASFLRFCDFNAWDAAERICHYWKDRVDLFTRRRAFLPMTQTGEGAISQDDLVALHAGFFVNLPASTTSGQDVLFVDRTKSLQSASRECRLRCLFYMFQVLAQKESSQTKGILIFILLVQPRVQNFDPDFVTRAVSLMADSFAVKVHYHVLNCLPKSGKRPMIQSIIQRAVGFIMKSFPDCQLHTETTNGDLRALLMRMGLQVNGIPTGLGGSWKYEQHTKWCRKQAIQEKVVTHNPPLATTAARSNTSRRRQVSSESNESPSVPAAASSVEAELSAAMSIEDRNERKRRINVIHSRQKRERRKAEQKMLEDEAQSLKDKHELLKKESEMLKELLGKAQVIEFAMLNSSSPSAGPAASAAGMHSGNVQSTGIGGSSSLETLATRLMGSQSLSQQPTPSQPSDLTALARLLTTQAQQQQLPASLQVAAQDSQQQQLPASLQTAAIQSQQQQLPASLQAVRRPSQQQLAASLRASASALPVGNRRESQTVSSRGSSFQETAAQLMQKSPQERKMLLDLLMMNNPNFKSQESNQAKLQTVSDNNSALHMGETKQHSSSRSASFTAGLPGASNPQQLGVTNTAAPSQEVLALLAQQQQQQSQQRQVHPTSMSLVQYHLNKLDDIPAIANQLEGGNISTDSAALEEVLRLMNQQGGTNPNAALEEALRLKMQQNDHNVALAGTFRLGAADSLDHRRGSQSLVANSMLEDVLRNQNSHLQSALGGAGPTSNNNSNELGFGNHGQAQMSQLAQLALLQQQQQQHHSILHQQQQDQVSSDELTRIILAASTLQGNRP